MAKNGPSQVHFSVNVAQRKGEEWSEDEAEKAPAPGEYIQRNVSGKIPKSERLKVTAQIQFANGQAREIEALIDTGAEINIIHPRHVPEGMFEDSKKPLRLGMCNAVRLQGGKREATFIMRLKGTDIESKQKVELRIPTTAYDGEMVCDMLLSYTWLAQQNVLVNPRRHGLLFHEGCHMFWVEGLIQRKMLNKKDGDQTSMLASPLAVVMEEIPQPKTVQEGGLTQRPSPRMYP